MSVTHYESSKGPVEISTMPLRYAVNAAEKLKRECADGARSAEIMALDAHIARVSEEIAQAQVSHG